MMREIISGRATVPACEGLEQVCALAGCMDEVPTDPRVRRLRPGHHTRSFASKEMLFQQGAPARHLYLLRSGVVKLSTTLPDGRHQGLRLAFAGSLVGLEVLVDERYPCAAEAVTPVEACVIRHKDLTAALTARPDLALGVIVSLSNALRSSNELICSLGRMNSTERIASFLLSVLPAEGGPAGDTPLPLSRTDIAEMLGLTLETVCRVLSRFARDGIIFLQPNSRRCRVLDRERLELLAGAAEPVAPLLHAPR